MPTFEVVVPQSKLLDRPRYLRVPAPNEKAARRRAARRAIALAQPGLGPSIGTEEFHRVAGSVAAGLKPRRVVVKLVTERTPVGGTRQYWKAEDVARDFVGVGRRRRTALRNLRPAEEAIR